MGVTKKKKEVAKKAKAEDAKICHICGELIVGDYEIAGHSRGCAAENCDRYVKGDRMEQKKGWVDE